MDRGVWLAIVRGVANSLSDTAEATEHAAHAGHEKLHVLSDPQKPPFLWQDIKWHLKD